MPRRVSNVTERAKKHINNELQRLLMLEVGFRCPLCPSTEGLDFEHIVDRAKGGKNEFTNMIVLCATCHRRKKRGSRARDLNSSSLKRLKQNLMLLNGRYSDLERRVISEFGSALSKTPNGTPMVLIHHSMEILVKYLIIDGIAEARLQYGGYDGKGFNGIPITNDQLLVIMTDAGRKFVSNLNAVKRNIKPADVVG